MRKTKFLITVILLICCFILNSSLYQSYLSSFETEYNYIYITTTKENYKDLPLFIEKLSKSLGKPFFYIEETTNIYNEKFIDVFCSENAYNEFSKHKELKTGVFKDALSGKTTISFHNITYMQSSIESYEFYFPAEKHEFETIHSKINQRFTSGYIHQIKSNGEIYFSMGLWALFGIIYIFLCFIDLQFQKKEMFLKISLGMPRYKIVFGESFKDISSFAALFLIVKLLLANFFYTDFNLSSFITIILITIILNFGLYLSIYKINYKEIVYGGNIGEHTVANCYLIKVVSMVLTVLLSCINLSLIFPNIPPLANAKHVDNLNDSYFINLKINENYENDIEELSPYYAKLTIDALKENNATVAINNYFFGKGSRDFILSNDMSLLLNTGTKESFDTAVDYLIFLPYDIEEEKEPVEAFLDSSYFFIEQLLGININQLNGRIIYCNKKSKAIYFDLEDTTNAKLGYAVSDNPVFIYCNTKTIDYSKCNYDNLSEYQTKNVLYKNDFFNKNSNFVDEDIVTIEKNSAKNVFSHNKATLFRNVLLCSIIILLQLLTDICMISILIKTEYTANAMELSLKKIIGYSILSKNKSLIFLNVYSASIGILTAIILFFMLSIKLKLLATIVGLCILCIEILILFISIRNFEQKNVGKILKGGVL